MNEFRMMEYDSKENHVNVEFKTPPKASLFWAAMSRWFSMGISILLGLLITPVIIKTLGNEAYGLWGLAASFVGFYGLFDFGVGAAICRFLGHALGAKNLKHFENIMSTGRSIYFIIALVIIVVALVIMEPARSLLRIPEEYTTPFRILVMFSATGIAFSTITTVYSMAITASEGFIFLSLVQIATAVIRAIGGLAAVLSGMGVVGLAATQVVVTILQQPVIYAGCKRRLPQMKVRFFAFDKTVAKSMFGFSAAVFILMIAEMVRSKMDVMLVMRFGGLGEAGLYVVASTAFSYIFRAMAAVFGVSGPRLNKLYGAGNMTDLCSFFKCASHITAAITVLICGTFIGLAPLLIHLWLGPGYERSAGVLRILVAGFFLDFATNPGISSLIATTKIRYFTVQTVFEAIASFTLAAILGKKFGMTGVALGIVVPITLVKLTVQPWCVARNLGISFTSYWLRVIAMPTLANVTLVSGLLSLNYWVNQWGWWISPFVLLPTMMVSCEILWNFVLDKSDREYILSRIKVRMDRLSARTPKMSMIPTSQSEVE
jgi:O-antigen/teichoic acid export membrane protein